VSLWLIFSSNEAQAQKKTADLKAPEPGYVFPPGGKAGTTVEVKLGGYDWTPDVELFVLDPRVKLQLTGEQGPILVPPPPYWFGAKSTLNALPLPRERPAKFTLPADLPPGPIRWAVASASGAGLKTGIFWVGTEPEVTEERATKIPQKLPALPITVNGRLSRNEEVDRYRFTASKDGPVMCEVFARRLGVNMNASVTIHDAQGKLVAATVDTDGEDLALTFTAKAGHEYTVNICDFDFRGDASFVYRLAFKEGPRPAMVIPLEGTAIRGAFEGKTTEAPYWIEGKKGDIWNLAAEARRFGSPLDLSLAVLDATGKELARNDDLPGTTDAGLTFILPVDGTFTVVVSDLSGKGGAYRFTAEKAQRDFALTTVARLNVPLGGAADLVVKVERKGGMKEPIALAIAGLPEGVTAPTNLIIPADKAELKIALTGAENAGTGAAFITVTGTAGDLVRPAKAPIPGSFAVRYPPDEQTTSILLATTLAPRLKLVQVEADGGRKVHRGSTHPAEVTLERLNGFKGEVSLQMSAAQSYQRQGITGPDMTVPADADRAFYPCFMPEWLETTRTSRMELIGVVKVPDAKGKMRYLATPMSGRITMSIEGAILKVSAEGKELKIKPGETVAIPVAVLRSAKLAEPVQLELKLPEELAGMFTAEPVTVAVGQTSAVFKLTCAKDAKFDGEATVTIRGTAMQEGRYAVVSEATVKVEPAPK
jgi:hypothetical protein